MYTYKHNTELRTPDSAADPYFKFTASRVHWDIITVTAAAAAVEGEELGVAVSPTTRSPVPSPARPTSLLQTSRVRVTRQACGVSMQS